jgi:Ca2+-binding RTX toxin-like protein
MAVQFRSGAGVTTASTAPQRVIYDTSTGELRFYRDGAGGDDAQIFAVLVGTPGLSAGDIHLF